MSKYIIVGDVETAPMDKNFKGVSPRNMMVYDFGWIVCDKKGNVIIARSYINIDVFVYEKELMKSAYYKEKVPQYWEQIKNGESKLATLNTIRKQYWADVEEYGVDETYFHNAYFDVNALNNTQRYETKSKYRWFFPYDMKLCDSLKMSRDVIGKMPTYKKFCEENGYMTKHKTPRPRLTAEILYRFISGNNEFVEEHKGLDDVMIEKEIVAYCYRQHKKMRKALYEK